MTRQLRPSATCLNCGHAVTTRFCPDCGQENTTYRVSLGVPADRLRTVSYGN